MCSNIQCTVFFWLKNWKLSKNFFTEQEIYQFVVTKVEKKVKNVKILIHKFSFSLSNFNTQHKSVNSSFRFRRVCVCWNRKHLYLIDKLKISHKFIQPNHKVIMMIIVRKETRRQQKKKKNQELFVETKIFYSFTINVHHVLLIMIIDWLTDD